MDTVLKASWQYFKHFFLSFSKMKTMTFRVTIFCFFCLFGLGCLNAQEQGTIKKYSRRYCAKHPVWIQMMQEENANYEATINAFKAYWKNRNLPKEAGESGDDSFEKAMGLNENKNEEKESKKEPENGINYAAEVRAFKGWMQSNAAWVKPEGYLMTQNERQAIINAQQAELKAIEIKNKK